MPKSETRNRKTGLLLPVGIVLVAIPLPVGIRMLLVASGPWAYLFLAFALLGTVLVSMALTDANSRFFD